MSGYMDDTVRRKDTRRQDAACRECSAEDYRNRGTNATAGSAAAGAVPRPTELLLRFAGHRRANLLARLQCRAPSDESSGGTCSGAVSKIYIGNEGARGRRPAIGTGKPDVLLLWGGLRNQFESESETPGSRDWRAGGDAQRVASPGAHIGQRGEEAKMAAAAARFSNAGHRLNRRTRSCRCDGRCCNIAIASV